MLNIENNFKGTLPCGRQALWPWEMTAASVLIEKPIYSKVHYCALALSTPRVLSEASHILKLTETEKGKWSYFKLFVKQA